MGMKSSVKATQRQENGKKGSSNKSARTQKVLKEALARLLTVNEDVDEDMHQYTVDDAFHEVNEDVENEDDECTTCDMVVEHDQAPIVHALLTQSRQFIIDSGCRGAHVVSSDAVVQKNVDTSSWKKMPVVRGISGHQIKTTDVGTLPGLNGMALVTPDAEESLLSLMELVKHNDGSFHGDSKQLTVTDGRAIQCWLLPTQEMIFGAAWRRSCRQKYALFRVSQ